MSRWRVSRSPARWPARLAGHAQYVAVQLCQSITGALACAPSLCRRPCPLSPVSVDHRRAGLRALEPLRAAIDGRKCQSITGALACAPSRAAATRIRASRVSRSPARWPARRQGPPEDQLIPSVSRSPARWPARRKPPESAAKQWNVSVDHRRAGLRALAAPVASLYGPMCQSITGALACAPSISGPLVVALDVSVDHRRAGLRAGKTKV